MRQGMYRGRAVSTHLVCLTVFLLLTRHISFVFSLHDDSADFLQEYFSSPDKISMEECTRRMRPCLPWENDCCPGLQCTNYAGRSCEYDHEMCVCTRRKSGIDAHIEQRDFL